MDFANILYIDPSISSAGNGATPATALKTIAGSALQNDTMYVIRRTTSDQFLVCPNGSTTVDRVGFVGMPVQADDPVRYDSMPAEAKTAWGADAATKAQMRVTSTSYLTMSSCRDFEFYNINLERASSSMSYAAFYISRGKASTSGSPAVMQENSYDGTIAIDRCRFAGYGEPLDDPTYTTAPTSGYGFGYIQQGGVHTNCSFTNSVICLSPPSSGMSSSAGITFSNLMGSLVISNIKSYSITTGTSRPGMYGSAQPTINITSDQYWAHTIICDVEHLIRRTATGLSYNGFINFTNESYGATTTFLQNLRCSEWNNFGTPATLYLSSSIFKVWGYTTGSLVPHSFEADTITVTLPELACIPSSSPVVALGVVGSSSSSAYFDHTVKNLNVTLAGTGGGIGPTNTFDEISTLKSGNTTYVSYYAATFFINCVITDSVINAPWCRAVALRYSEFITTGTINGSVTLWASKLRAAGVTTSWYGSAILWIETCVISVDTVTVDTVTESQEPLLRVWEAKDVYMSYVYVKNSNKLTHGIQPMFPADTNDQTYYRTGGAVLVNNNGKVGRITVTGTNYAADTWSSRRSGGADASIKLWGNQVFSGKYMPLAMPTSMTEPVTVAGAQKLRVTIHVAYLDILKFYRCFNIECIGSTGRVVSFGVGNWEPDADQWLDVPEGLVKLKWSCVVPGDTVSFRFYFNGFSSSGYMLLDPKFDIVAVA